MDLLIILIYSGFCVLIFKLFRIPLNKWSVPTAILGGIALLGTMILLMNFNHPYGKFSKEVYAVVPVVPPVKGIVQTVEVKPNIPLKQGDILFTIDPKPYQLKVDELEATLMEAKQSAMQLGSQLEFAQAKVKQALAERDRTRTAYNRYRKGSKNNAAAFARQTVDDSRQMYLAAQANADAAQADLQRVTFAHESNIDGVNTQVVELQKKLESARYDLERTVVRAPSDGIATQIALKPGIMAVPLPLSPAMVFIPKQERVFAGSFWQNSLGMMKPGFETEMILDAVPGHVFKGEVISVLPAMSEGQYQASGQLLSANQISRHGRAIALIKVTEEDLEQYQLPLGVQGKMVIYSDQFTHVAVMRKVLLRMLGWLNYVFPVK
ncbi:HlyD family secretion protein [Aliamphritea ceti]|uniref:HlyD family secretion protein n=1 Tax=Aliamphritea ceti TaxID=1524258 RepID=UPI0021C2BD85|nr:biotin/lipoyl-binding protein [Aliamphritea ceti]